MSRRKSIVNALVAKLKEINGSSTYSTNLYNNVYPKLKFWDEVNDFPCLYVTAGGETRDYMPSAFKWGFLAISIKAYVKQEEAQDALEALLEDVEKLLDSTLGVLIYDEQGNSTSEISITSINTDEGLLEPYGVGEISLQIRYQVS